MKIRICLLLALIVSVHADTFTLKDGKVIDGIIVKVQPPTEAMVTVKTETGTSATMTTFPFSQLTDDLQTKYADVLKASSLTMPRPDMTSSPQVQYVPNQSPQIRYVPVQSPNSAGVGVVAAPARTAFPPLPAQVGIADLKLLRDSVNIPQWASIARISTFGTVHTEHEGSTGYNARRTIDENWRGVYGDAQRLERSWDKEKERAAELLTRNPSSSMREWLETFIKASEALDARNHRDFGDAVIKLAKDWDGLVSLNN